MSRRRTLAQYRLGLMLNEDNPTFPNWDQDATAVEDRYNLADPAAVKPALLAAAEGTAAIFDSLTQDQWQCTGVRSDGAIFTVETFGLYMTHDPAHHLWDVEQ